MKMDYIRAVDSPSKKSRKIATRARQADEMETNGDLNRCITKDGSDRGLCHVIDELSAATSQPTHSLHNRIVNLQEASIWGTRSTC
jgi:hypothetical protein